MAGISCRTDGDINIVEFEETKILDAVQTDIIANALTDTLHSISTDKLLVNLGGVQFISSAMINRLFTLYKRCNKEKIQLKFCELSSPVAETLKLVRLDQLADIYDTEQQAIESFAT